MARHLHVTTCVRESISSACPMALMTVTVYSNTCCHLSAKRVHFLHEYKNTGLKTTSKCMRENTWGIFPNNDFSIRQNKTMVLFHRSPILSCFPWVSLWITAHEMAGHWTKSELGKYSDIVNVSAAIR